MICVAGGCTVHPVTNDHVGPGCGCDCHNALDLVAGREMDALIAEKVFGWKRPKGAGVWEDDGAELVDDPSGYSTDISKALQVVDKLKIRGYFWDIKGFANQWNVWVSGDKTSANVDDENIALAICLAALNCLCKHKDVVR